MAGEIKYMEVPHAGVRWRFYLFGMTPPVRFRDWAEREVLTPRFYIGWGVAIGLFLAITLAGWFAGAPLTTWAGLIGFSVGVAGSLGGDPRRNRKRLAALARHRKKWAKEAGSEGGAAFSS